MLWPTEHSIYIHQILFCFRFHFVNTRILDLIRFSHFLSEFNSNGEKMKLAIWRTIIIIYLVNVFRHTLNTTYFTNWKNKSIRYTRWIFGHPRTYTDIWHHNCRWSMSCVVHNSLDICKNPVSGISHCHRAKIRIWQRLFNNDYYSSKNMLFEMYVVVIIQNI